MKFSLLPVCILAALSGCRGMTSSHTPIVGVRNMYDQPRYDAQEKQAFFGDGRSMRQHPYGTVGRYEVDEAAPSPEVNEGRRSDDSGWVDAIPASVAQSLGGAEAMLVRGRERYNIYCSPCHSRTGVDEGMIVQRGMTKPPVFSDPKLRTMPDGQVFATITNGARTMPAYYAQIPVRDRWAIVAHVRALQIASFSEAGTP